MNTVENTISQVLTAIIMYSVDQNTSATASNQFASYSYTTIRPVATLVGTHLDKLEEDTVSVEEQLKQKHRELKHITDNFSQVIVNPEGDKIFGAK